MLFLTLVFAATSHPLGSTLKGLLRASDATGRIGGDEFALLLPGLGAADARAVADRTVAALGERIGATAGVAWHPTHGDHGRRAPPARRRRALQPQGHVPHWMSGPPPGRLGGAWVIPGPSG
jgi:hypothetical protein